jgi:hypothetical protein
VGVVLALAFDGSRGWSTESDKRKDIMRDMSIKCSVTEDLFSIQDPSRNDKDHEMKLTIDEAIYLRDVLVDCLTPLHDGDNLEEADKFHREIAESKHIYTVYMIAFNKIGVTREVDISKILADMDPSLREDLLPSSILELIFKYGQNDFMQVEPPCCSVSVCDVVELDGELHMVGGTGFFKISRDTFDDLPGELARQVMFPKNEEDLLKQLGVER